MTPAPYITRRARNLPLPAPKHHRRPWLAVSIPRLAMLTALAGWIVALASLAWLLIP